ncbi:MAG: hypothetical protein ABIU77_13320 [Ferruginibacter sp.]
MFLLEICPISVTLLAPQRFALPKGRESMLVPPGGNAYEEENYQLKRNYQKKDATPNR